MGLRDKTRYGEFSAYSSDIGNCMIKIFISGWTDGIEVYKNKELVADGELITEDEELDDDKVEETEGGFEIYCTKIHDWITVNKPLGKCLKRYK